MITELAIRPFEEKDWLSVSEIYRQGLDTRNATFETEVPEYHRWITKFNPSHLWVAEIEGVIAGWAGLQPVSARKVYEGVVEVSVYVGAQYNGKGIGRALMNHLIYESERSGIWTLYSSIFPENTSSIRLHLSSGFREIGYREKIAKLDGVWRNTILFERRSKVTGV